MTLDIMRMICERCHVNGTNENGAWDWIKIRARIMNWLTRINASAGVNKSDAYKKWERRRDKQWPNFNGLRTTLMNVSVL